MKKNPIIEGMKEERARAAARAKTAQQELEGALRDVKDWDARISRAERRARASRGGAS